LALWQRDLLPGEGVADDKISYIANGVPVQAIESRSVQRNASLVNRWASRRAQRSLPTSRVFAPQKRQDLTLRTVAALREKLGDVRVVFAGDGPELESVRALADELSADWAIFLGAYDNVPSVFRVADVAVLPSTGEGLPMAILEAVAVRVPVVAGESLDARAS
jgi:glycosyltransferase involved in cell wall biosynthesis